ncbi:MAG: CbtB-domain containing protein [Chloroflexi bacterium]|nr:CbtB-domain containing protein [Chloroflexota bacterium]
MARFADPAVAPLPEFSPIPLRDVLPWAVFATALAASLLYLFGIEQGALSVFPSNLVHEFVHDARHLAGLPCH